MARKKNEKHPSVAKVRELGNIFITLGKNPKLKVDMMEGVVNPCGTVACHAGHFGIYLMQLNDPAISLKLNKLSYKAGRTDLETNRGVYLMYADFMAEFLEIGKERSDLSDWAECNSEIWGNGEGDGIFSLAAAFGKSEEEGVTLTEIGEHWLGVADRLEKYLGGTK